MSANSGSTPHMHLLWLPLVMFWLAFPFAAVSTCSPIEATVTPTPSVLPDPTATTTPSPTPERTPVYTYRVINVYPHDPEAFTQGLEFYRPDLAGQEDGYLYEGTGLRGRSSLRKVELETGRVLQMRELPPEYFGEGITILGERIYQLTWTSKVGFVYDRETFELLQEFYYPTEGWGVTNDGEHLIMSDGSPILYWRDPVTFAEVRRVEVFDEQGLVERLNELEYIEGEIWANIWQTDLIARIDPSTGRVVAWVDLTDLLCAGDHNQTPDSPCLACLVGSQADGVDVLNGIAYDAEKGRIFVTGKLWPKLFEIELVPG